MILFTVKWDFISQYCDGVALPTPWFRHLRHLRLLQLCTLWLPMLKYATNTEI
jgi:hypothetical protein